MYNDDDSDNIENSFSKTHWIYWILFPWHIEIGWLKGMPSKRCILWSNHSAIAKTIYNHCAIQAAKLFKSTSIW